jgi:phosphorylase kinase alpha/beta subunit
MSDLSEHIDSLLDLRTESGLFFASQESVETGYDKAWLRDNFYISLGLEAADRWQAVQDLWKAILKIFAKHQDKIKWAIEHQPHESWQYIHARYHPETFEEFWEEWGNKQHDAIGAILFKLGDLQQQGRGVIQTDREQALVQHLIDYLASVEYWHDPDNGVWEEYEEVHASSVGACVAGLKKIQTLDFTDVPDGLITKGEDALEALLPRESESKFCDLAQLSLLFPYDLVTEEHADTILERIQYYFARQRGVIRYKNDQYYNRNEDGVSEEAEWCFGFSWLAIIHQMRGDSDKAKKWIKKAEETVTAESTIPELYYANTHRPNENNPLGWAESMYIIARLQTRTHTDE